MLESRNMTLKNMSSMSRFEDLFKYADADLDFSTNSIDGSYLSGKTNGLYSEYLIHRNLALDEVIPKVYSILKNEAVVGGLVSIDTLRYVIRLLKEVSK